MGNQERRDIQQEKSGRRISSDRRLVDAEYNGMDRRANQDRRTTVDRRNT